MLRVSQLVLCAGIGAGLIVPTTSITPAQASPWPQAPGEGLVISRTGWFAGTSDETSYNQTDAEAYLEYGLGARTTLGANFSYAMQWNDGDFPARSTGFSIAEVFAQRTLRKDDRTVLTARLIVAADTGLTLYRPDGAEASLGLDPALEPGLLVGRALSDDGRVFAGLEAGWRASLGADADRARIQLTLGTKPAPQWLLLVKSYNSVVTDAGRTAWSDYDVYRGEISAVYTTPRQHSYELGLRQDLGGRNIATGTAVYFSIWSRF